MTVDQLDGARVVHEVDPMANPALANSLSAKFMADDEETPVMISPPPDGLVTLPGGYIARNGTVVHEATVREMRGDDEEELARPAVAKDFTRFIRTVLSRCVVKLGDEQPVTPAMIDELLIGDQEMLLQGIRVATYGDTMDLDLTCPNCSEKFKVNYSFTADVPVKKLDGLVVKLNDGEHMVTLDSGRRTYLIPLRKGGNAEVRLIDGGTQRTVYTTENAQRTDAELNSLLLAQCVLNIDGQSLAPGQVRMMSAADRAQIIKFLSNSQPGPQWDEVKQACPACDREFPLVIDVPSMFRSF